MGSSDLWRPCVNRASRFWPLLKIEWVGSGKGCPSGAVKDERSPAQGPLKAPAGYNRAECGMVRHSAMAAMALGMQKQLFEAALGIVKPWHVRALILMPRERC